MIDLHIHSTFSDGSLTPEEIVNQARELKLHAVALTDHDSTGGLDRFLAACGNGNGDRALIGIPGVEISAGFDDGAMHLLGYFFDHRDATLQAALERVREGRGTRNAEILANLNRLGIGVTDADVARHVGEDVVGRPHIAAAMQAAGHVTSRREAFTRYLARGGAAYADRYRLGAEEAIRLIRAAGGVAVLAHPGAMSVGRARLHELVKRLTAAGLGGIEAYYPLHSPRDTEVFVSLAAEFGLAVAGGSDFHGAMTPDIGMGSGFGSLKVPNRIVDELRGRCG